MSLLWDRGQTGAKPLHPTFTRPSQGERALHLRVEVRRFFCPKATCRRKIFAERFPFLALSHAQCTLRLQRSLRVLGFALGGQAGACVSKQLHLSASRDTILRLVRQSPLPAPEPPRVVGVDAWAWKRRLRYGTLLCDLERRIPLDVLPDRAVGTVAAWCKKNPSIEVISRNRSPEFAAAASQGAPQAVQVADRWHLGKNLAETLSAVLARCRAEQGRANRERGGQHLETWLQAAEASHIPEFETFAAGVRQEQAAICAGLTLPWSSGQMEGQITRLKLLKRSMYGRAKFDLLRLRVLHRAEDNQQENETSRRGHMYKHSLNPVH
jgi:Transposase